LKGKGGLGFKDAEMAAASTTVVATRRVMMGEIHQSSEGEK